MQRVSPSETAGAVADRTARTLALTAGALVFAAGLWVSFHYATGAWSLDSDTAVPLALWQGLRRHGLAFVSSWYYTPDNWLLSLVPISGLAFEAFGTGPQVVTATGWMIFVASVVMTAWLGRGIAGPRLGLALACVLIYASFDALGGVGFMAHPVTHDISMAWALMTLLAALRAVERGEAWAVALVGVCVFANVLSDPWAGPALAGPLFLVCGVIAWLRRREGGARGAAPVAAATLVAVLLAATRGFGLFSFLPRAQFVFTGLEGVLTNAYWALRAFAHMFNIVPGGDPDARAVKIIDSAALILLLSVSGAWSLAAIRAASVRRQLVVGVSVLSVAAVSAAFLLGRWDPNLNVGRFFPNLYFFSGLVVVAALSAEGGSRPTWSKAAIVAYALLFVAAGVSSRPDLWIHRQPAMGVQEARSLGDFLTRQRLTYGYGPYWGAHALVVEAATEGRVRIRPVTFRSGRIARRPAESSSYWYRPEDEPAGDPRRFLVIRNDGEECPSVQACVGMATRQFGAPSETLTYGDATIMVWPGSVRARIDP